MITLITDFNDYYAGLIKGPIYKINPKSIIIDITHNIRRHSIYEAAFVIFNSYSHFPKGTIHIVVVDPGVGSQRVPIVIKYDDHTFVGPDNGVFSFLEGDTFKIDLEKLHHKLSKYGLTNISTTFHGRDIFAPTAALLELGEMNFLEKFHKKSTLTYQKQINNDSAVLSVLYIDSFGNIILNLKKEDIKIKEIEISDLKIPVLTHYKEGKNFDLIALYSSSGHLEISKYLGNANAHLNLKSGDVLQIRIQRVI